MSDAALFVAFVFTFVVGVIVGAILAYWDSLVYYRPKKRKGYVDLRRVK